MKKCKRDDNKRKIRIRWGAGNSVRTEETKKMRKR